MSLKFQKPASIKPRTGLGKEPHHSRGPDSDIDSPALVACMNSKQKTYCMFSKSTRLRCSVSISFETSPQKYDQRNIYRTYPRCTTIENDFGGKDLRIWYTIFRLLCPDCCFSVIINIIVQTTLCVALRWHPDSTGQKA